MNPDERAKLMAAASDDRALLLAKSPPRPCAGTNRGVRTNIDCPLARHHRGWKGPRSMKVCSKGSTYLAKVRYFYSFRCCFPCGLRIRQSQRHYFGTRGGAPRDCGWAERLGRFPTAVCAPICRGGTLVNRTSSLDLKTECRHTKT
jgi:hypothetical protein